MKRLLAVLLIIPIVLLLSTTVSAHSGRTDSNGGHYNHETGEYHYHHGYPEHQHINGQCPYLIKEKEKQEILEQKKDTNYKKEDNESSTFAKIVGSVFVAGMGAWLIASLLCCLLSFCFKKYEDIFMGKVLVISTILLSVLLFIFVFNSM